MLEVLYFSDKAVKEKLFALARKASRPLVVAGVPPHRADHPSRLEPFASLEREHGDVVDQVLVVDQGKSEGMWRDPVTDLADALWPQDSRAAYAASRGVFVVRGFAPLAVVPATGSPEALGFALREALAKVVPGIPAPDETTRPRGRAAAPKGKAPRASTTVREDEERFRTTAESSPPPAEEAGEEGPDVGAALERLNLPPHATRSQAKKAWRELLVQYHPDKVSHLAPEFRALAEEKTRALNEAWALLEQALPEE